MEKALRPQSVLLIPTSCSLHSCSSFSLLFTHKEHTMETHMKQEEATAASWRFRAWLPLSVGETRLRAWKMPRDKQSVQGLPARAPTGFWANAVSISSSLLLFLLGSLSRTRGASDMLKPMSIFCLTLSYIWLIFFPKLPPTSIRPLLLVNTFLLQKCWDRGCSIALGTDRAMMLPCSLHKAVVELQRSVTETRLTWMTHKWKNVCLWKRERKEVSLQQQNKA